MAFSSQIYAGEPIIHDTSPEELYLPPPGMSRGLMLEGRSTPFGQIRGTVPFPAELLVDMSGIQAMIQEHEEKKCRLSDLIRQSMLPHKDQNGTNYCWINAPTHCVEIVILIQSGKVVSLSPASVGAKIKNFSNSGGWGEEGLVYIVEKGINETKDWPDNAISRKYDTPENAELKKLNTVTEWWELKPRNLHELASLLIRLNPGAAGYNWWSHEVTALELVWIDGALALRIRNSWKNYGDYGMAILQGNKMLPDDLVAPVVVRQS